MPMEESKYFKKVDNIAEYVKGEIKSGRLTVDEVAKFARIHARQGTLGEKIITKMANGLEETRNTVVADEKTGEPGWVVTNPNGEEYIVPDSTFKKKYEIDPENPEQYKPKGGPVLSALINENIEFDAPWGEAMKIEAGGSLILNGPNDIYGIQKAEFENTYASTGKDKAEALKEAISLLGISKDEVAEDKVAEDEWLKEYEERQAREIAEAKAKIPAWVEKGASITYPERMESWKECVKARADDIYHGKELDEAIQLMEMLDSGASMEDVIKTFNEQGHSVASGSMVRRILFHYSKKGPEFFESTALGKLSPGVKQAISDKKKENAELDELHKADSTKEIPEERRSEEKEITHAALEKEQLTSEISRTERQLAQLQSQLQEKQAKLNGPNEPNEPNKLEER